MPTETLTVRVTAETSSFRREMESVSGRLSDLQSKVDQLSSRASGLASQSWFDSLESGLSRLPQQIGRLSSQLQNLSATPITLNIAPAIQQLTLLGTLARQVGQQIRSISGGTGGGSFGGFPGGTGYANGGLVRGPSGIDRVPAMLTDGEFVLRREAVRNLGLPVLQSLNQQRETTATTSRASAVPSSPPRPASITHVGGMTIHVRETADVNSLVRDLRSEGVRLKNRRG